MVSPCERFCGVVKVVVVGSLTHRVGPFHFQHSWLYRRECDNESMTDVCWEARQ